MPHGRLSIPFENWPACLCQLKMEPQIYQNIIFLEILKSVVKFLYQIENKTISFAVHRNVFSLHAGLPKVSLVQVCHNFSFSWDISVI